MPSTKPATPKAQAPAKGSATKTSASKTSTPSKPSAASGRRQSRTVTLRRPPSSGWPLVRYKILYHWQRLLEMCPLWIGLFLAVALWCLVPRSLFWIPPTEVGTIASQTYIADRLLSVPNEAATSEVQQRAADRQLPVYDFDRSLETDRRQQIAALFASGRALLLDLENAEAPPKPADGKVAEDEIDPSADLFARLSSESPLKLTPEQIKLLRDKGFSTELEDRLSGAVMRVLRQGVVGNKALLLEHRVRGITLRDLPSDRRMTQLDLYGYLGYPDQVLTTIEQDLRGWSGFSAKERRLLSELILANIAPNLTFNSNETLNLRQQAVDQVGTVFHQIRKGEVIVRQGDLVDDLAAQAIAVMAGSRDVNRLLLAALGTFLLLSAAIFLLWLKLDDGRASDHSRQRLLNESLILLMLHLMAARFAFFVSKALSGSIQQPPFNSLASYTYAIPLASLALMSVLLYGRQTAWILSLIFAVLVGHIAGGDAIWSMTLYCLAGSLAAISALDRFHFKQRSVTTRAGVIIGLVNVGTVLSLKALTGAVGGGVAQLGFDILCGFTGGLLAAAVTSFSVPILEGMFGITTHIKLIELANPNLPLLRRLAFEAPGTFQHSLAVGNLAKAGCEAIDADSVLVHTGALYHDIGKLKRPQYFIENQLSGQNPHDKTQPSMSALILINHVKEGLELAQQAHLPQPILDAIEQHHGNRLIKFFYNKAKERCDPDTEAIREDEFRYPGPKPQSKEMGVLMLADAVEAASRTLVEASPQKIRVLLRTLFDDCLQDGQLDQTDLTLRDLRRVEEAFHRVLTNIYHRRIDYPGFDFNRPGGASRRASKVLPGKTLPGKTLSSKVLPGKASSQKASPDKAAEGKPRKGSGTIAIGDLTDDRRKVS